MDYFVDYAYYESIYGGTLSEEVFHQLLPRSCFYLNQLTRGRATIRAESESVKMATCAVLDAMNQNESGGAVASETIGSWSRTFISGAAKSADQALYEAAMSYLGGTDIMPRWC